jgi:hypothetical protein
MIQSFQLFSSRLGYVYGISWFFVVGVCTWAPQIINVNGMKEYIQDHLRVNEQRANARRRNGNQNNGNQNAEQSSLLSAFNRLKSSCNSNLNNFLRELIEDDTCSPTDEQVNNSIFFNYWLFRSLPIDFSSA